MTTPVSGGGRPVAAAYSCDADTPFQRSSTAKAWPLFVPAGARVPEPMVRWAAADIVDDGVEAVRVFMGPMTPPAESRRKFVHSRATKFSIDKASMTSTITLPVAPLSSAAARRWGRGAPGGPVPEAKAAGEKTAAKENAARNSSKAVPDSMLFVGVHRAVVGRCRRRLASVKFDHEGLIDLDRNLLARRDVEQRARAARSEERRVGKGGRARWY